jgi:hypothetical protein
MTKYGSLLPSQHFPPAKVLDILPAFLGNESFGKSFAIASPPRAPTVPASADFLGGCHQRRRNCRQQRPVRRRRFPVRNHPFPVTNRP